MFVPTHITNDGLLLQVAETTPQELGRRGEILGMTADGQELVRHWQEVWHLDTPNAEEILAQQGLRLERAVQEDDSNRTALARWAVAVNESRQALVNGLEQVLKNRDTGLNTRRMLEDSLLHAQAELAKFRP